MEDISPITISRIYIGVLFALWTYFFIYSYRYKTVYPWGFGLIVAGMFLSRISYRLYNDQGVVFAISIPLLICFAGAFINIINIRSQFYIASVGELFRYTVIGLTFGLLFGFLITAAQGVDCVQLESRYALTALVASGVQSSLSEEFLFRGYFLGYLRRYEFNQFLAVLLQACMFTALHIYRYSNNWAAILIVFIFGVTTGCLAWKSKNIISVCVLHVAANLLAIFNC